MGISTFHNHTSFCDGDSSVEEMVNAAIEAGCASLGFSGHSYTWFDESYCMSKEGTLAYRAQIEHARKNHPDLRILCGIEQDYFSCEPTDGYDFVIGSVHYVRVVDGDGNERYLGVDDSEEDFIAHVNTYFGGDYYALCEAYYAEVADVHRKTGCTFVGHFDLVTKYNEGDRLFSTEHPRYREAALRALRSLCAEGCLFEVNSGAMVKGYRTAPYPADFLLDEIRAAGCSVILSCDCHNAAAIQAHLDVDRARGCRVVREI